VSFTVLVRPHHQLNTIEIGRHPFVAMDQELEMLLILGREHHDRASIFDHAGGASPQQMTDPSADVAGEDTRADL